MMSDHARSTSSDPGLRLENVSRRQFLPSTYMTEFLKVDGPVNVAIQSWHLHDLRLGWHRMSQRTILHSGGVRLLECRRGEHDMSSRSASRLTFTHRLS